MDSSMDSSMDYELIEHRQFPQLLVTSRSWRRRRQVEACESLCSSLEE